MKADKYRSGNMRFVQAAQYILVALFTYSVVRPWDSQLREPLFESSCCNFEALAIFSLSCMEYLATDRWIYE